MKRFCMVTAAVGVLLTLGYGSVASAATAGTPGENDLVIASKGRSEAQIVVSPAAAGWEERAAADLAHYIELMTGAKVPVVNTPEAIAAAAKATTPVLVVGQQALKVDPTLNDALSRAAKKNPELRADAIVLRRNGNRVLLAGLNEDCHYYAVAELLSRWGCRWYLPTEFGQCIPTEEALAVGALDYAYGPPFEVRKYWLSWIGDTTGQPEFMHRNRLNNVFVPNGHNLGNYTKDLAPPGKSVFNVPIAELATAEHVARQVSAQYGRGEHVMLGMEDGMYDSDSPRDKELMSLQFDKYFMRPAMTDAFMVFYNNVARILMREHPNSRARIGFLAYSNITLPPVRDVTALKPLVAYLAPIDIDPIHGMDDPKSPPRREYRDMLYKWAKVMQGRLVIYDYDQGMLVWRDFPNPSHQAFRQDVKHYRRAGILGVDTESRGAMATIFTNLFFRAQLLWNPEADVDALLAEFYPKFYGPAAEPMQAYWSAIYKAWEDSIVTEHEYFLAPAIYTPELMAALRKHLAEAEALVKLLASKADASRNEKLCVERLRFTRLSFDVMDSYLAMVKAAASDVDYAAAVAAGERGLAAREQLTALNGTFTTYKRIGESGYAWWPGEVQQYRELLAFTDGTKGKLLTKLPLEWAFHRDPKDAGLKASYATKPVDLTYWKAHAKEYTLETLKDYPVTEWEMLRTDLYAQAQGVRQPDQQSFTGTLWYRVDLELKAQQLQRPIHFRFPGIFNEGYLYVNGAELSHRPQGVLWWLNDYQFEWDINLTGKLKAGSNAIVVRLVNPHHFGGIFRRPFLYEPAGQ